MTESEIIRERDELMLNQLAQRDIMKDSDAHLCKCGKLGLDFKTTYPEEYESYVSANNKWHQNDDRIKELEEMVPDPEPIREDEIPE